MATTRNRKIGIAIAGGAIVAGVFAASAASLGTLTVDSLGTTAAVVAACNNGAGANITGWTALNYSGVATGATSPTSTQGSTYLNTGLSYSTNSATCAGKSFKLALADSTGATLAPEVTGTVGAGGSGAVTYAGVDSKKIEQVTLTVYG